MNAPLPIPPTWTTGSTASIKTGTWRAALAQHISAPSPCHAACPMHGEIATWIGQAHAGDLHGAWTTLSRHNPFPAVIGRVCHHPCETACNRAEVDGALAICKLERHVGDIALQRGWQHEVPCEHAPRSERVAVVGGGPSGLSAAYHLRRRGFAVTLFEAGAELGGVMRHGIPDYRLARQVLDAEIERVIALGIELRCNHAVATPQALAALRSQFDAVYLAYGARRPKRLAQLDYARSWVLDGDDYLAQANAGAAPSLGPRVVVIGGGSAAFDVARSARRAGHAVTMLALEAEAQLPAQHEELDEAREEGIVLRDATQLLGVTETSQGLRLQCVRVRFQAAARPGDFELTPLEGTQFAIEADAVVSAIGQDPDLGPLAGAVDCRGKLAGIDTFGATGAAGVWAGGDLASNARFVSVAIGMGERAALAIERELNSRAGAASAPPAEIGPTVPLSAINLHYHPPRARATAARLAVTERLAGNAEVQLALDIEQALAEAARCFSCGSCTHCDNCITYCPDLAVQRLGDGYTVLTDYCKGCGLCVEECPTGSMTMIEEAK